MSKGDIMQNRNRDGKGPAGKGPRTGRGLGNCPTTTHKV